MAQISSDTKIKGRLDVQSQIAQTNLRYNVSEIDEDNNQSVCDSRKNVVVNGKSITIKPDKIILNVNPSGNNNIVGYDFHQKQKKVNFSLDYFHNNFN